MEASSQVSIEQLYEDLLAEYKACQQHLGSKDEALKIFQQQLRESNIGKQRLEQEIKQLHAQLVRTQIRCPSSPSSSIATHPTLIHPSSSTSLSSAGEAGTYDSEREKYILELEEAQEKNSDLCRQIQVLEDEKEDVTGERDYYSGKCSNLMKCLEEERNTKPPSHSALQTVMEENRQLKLQLVDVQAERNQLLSRMERYKKAVERRKAKEKSLEQELPSVTGTKKQDLRAALRRICELESLANSLSESVKEKTISLSHQKRANKMLASRITELEHRLKVLEISGLWSSAASLLPDIDDPVLSPVPGQSTFPDFQNATVSTDGNVSDLNGSDPLCCSMEDRHEIHKSIGPDREAPLNPFDDEREDGKSAVANVCKTDDQCIQSDSRRLIDQCSLNKKGGIRMANLA